MPLASFSGVVSAEMLRLMQARSTQMAARATSACGCEVG